SRRRPTRRTSSRTTRSATRPTTSSTAAATARPSRSFPTRVHSKSRTCWTRPSCLRSCPTPRASVQPCTRVWRSTLRAMATARKRKTAADRATVRHRMLRGMWAPRPRRPGSATWSGESPPAGPCHASVTSDAEVDEEPAPSPSKKTTPEPKPQQNSP
ncbi:hypothetical protein IscW_ISCW009729, partial [Ixodes scapularis]